LAWLATIVYVPLAVFVLIAVAKQILKIDWLFVSLMLLPVPIVIGWLMVLSTRDTFLGSELVYEVAWWISLSFAVIALAVATFIRVRQRWMKAGALLTCSIMVLTVVALVGVNALNFWACLLLSLLMLLHLFLPAWLEHIIFQQIIKSISIRLFAKCYPFCEESLDVHRQAELQFCP
jgi:hypothetical protein